MPAGRGPRLREELGAGTSLVSDLYIDDAGVVAMSSPHVRSPCARRTAEATAALQSAGVEVHPHKGHDDQVDSMVWGAAFYSHLVGARARAS